MTNQEEMKADTENKAMGTETSGSSSASTQVAGKPHQSPKGFRYWLGWSAWFFPLTFLAFTMTLPFVWMLLGSFKPRNEVQQTHFIPKDWNPENYALVMGLQTDAIRGNELDIDFGRWYYNSIFTTLTVTYGQLLCCALAAYAFSRMRWPGRDKLFLLFLTTLMIPPVVLLIPNYQLMVTFNLVDSYTGIILPSIFFGTAFGTFLLRQFMMGIPRSLDEAAMIDGASHFRVFWEVIMPLVKPGLVTLAIFSLLLNYQSFFWPLVMLSTADLYTLPIGLLNFDAGYEKQTELILAATVLSVAPLIVIFCIAQKAIVEGIQMGSVKG